MATATVPEVRVSRDKDPLKHRRVRHRETDRLGFIQSSSPSYHGFTRPIPANAYVEFDDGERPYGGNWIKAEKVPLDELELLDPAPITSPVYVRKVLFRGHKEQVAEYFARLTPLDEDAVASGVRRFIEFDPQPMAYCRWRVVHVGPPMDPAQVAETPDQYPGAAHLRKLAKDAAYDTP